jgi:HK97 gp10 family phage protein
VSLTITGLREINQMLVRLGERGDELNAKALRPAAEAIKRRAQTVIPLGTGRTKDNKTYHLRQNISIRSMRSRKQGRVGWRVTQVGGNYAGETYYGSFVELGHYSGRRTAVMRREQRKGGEGAGGRRKVEGKWYMKQAAEQEENTALAIYEQEILKLLSLEAK